MGLPNEPVPDELAQRFDAAMLHIYDRAGHEVGYWATRYLQLVRRRGGLDAARYLLAQRLTSDGYARLRDAGRLDLTVEALVLQTEFESLFTEMELAHARDRLEQYRSMPVSRDLEPSEDLLAVLEEAAATPVNARIEFREQIAGFGSPAIIAMQRWVAAERSPGLAIAVIEVIGRTRDHERAITALRGLRTKLPDWTDVIEQTIGRLETLHRSKGK